MRIGWIGFHSEGVRALRAVVSKHYPVHALITLKPERAARQSGAADYADVGRELSIPVFEVESINAPESISLLKDMALDIVFVIGWTQLLREEVLRTARTGMIGAHASLLPRLRGRAPINWALINGETQTGNTLFWLTSGVDSGRIIDQTVIPITAYDTCDTLYEQVADSNEQMIMRVLPRLLRGENPGVQQCETEEPPLPVRRPEHGKIDWERSNTEIYNFIRALTRPYPGAFGRLDGERWFIWEAALIPFKASSDARPGQVLGPIYSPVDRACGQMVACGKGALALLKVEREDGHTLTGHNLSDRNWTDKVWKNE